MTMGRIEKKEEIEGSNNNQMLKQHITIVLAPNLP